MKRFSLLSIAVAISLFTLSCSRSSTKQQVSATNFLEGKWHLDSLKISSDTNIGHIIVLMQMQQPLGVNLQFRNDTLFALSQDGIDTTVYKLDPGTKEISFQGPKNTRYQICQLSDQRLTLQGANSAIFFLRRN